MSRFAVCFQVARASILSRHDSLSDDENVNVIARGYVARYRPAATEHFIVGMCRDDQDARHSAPLAATPPRR